MGNRIPWDEAEAAILLNYSKMVMDKELNSQKAIEIVSQKLRKKAQNEGIAIDSVFRNQNGITLQMNIMISLLEEKPYGINKASKLFINIVEMYKKYRNSFDLLLSHVMEDEDMLSQNNILKIDFTDIPNISFTKPLKLLYNGFCYTDFSNWSQLYVKILDLLYNDFTDKIVSLANKNISNENGRVEISYTSDNMISPKKFSGNMFIETNISATDMIKKICKLLDICELNYDTVSIYYQNKENKKSDIKEMNSTMSELLTSKNSIPSATTFSIINTLSIHYENGFKFDSTSINLLSAKSNYKIDESIVYELQKIMFKRKDDVYFLSEKIVDSSVSLEILKLADSWLDKYGFFEAKILYEHFSEDINQNIILDLDDFIDFYEFLNKHRHIRCVTAYNTKIFRINDNIQNLTSILINSLISKIHEDYCGTIDEYALQEILPAFSIELLDKIIKDYSDEVIRTNINDVICYQTLDALGLPDNLKDMIIETLDLIEDINLTPSVEVVHTVLSMKLSCNFKKEYNIPDDKTFKKIIETYFSGDMPRKWIKGVFLEEHNQNV